jgi:LysR family cyn operon transcriptional activator
LLIGSIVAINAVPEAMAGLKVIPLESPTPIRTPGILCPEPQCVGSG